MDIEEAKEQLLKHKKEIDAKYISARYSKAIEVVLNELDKKDKIIEDIKFINSNNKPHIAQQKIREYFTNKVEEDKQYEHRHKTSSNRYKFMHTRILPN